MNIPITKRWTLQVIWWGDGYEWPWVICQAWPWVSSRPASRKPLFYSLCIFWLELRWFDNEWPKGAPSAQRSEREGRNDGE